MVPCSEQPQHPYLKSGIYKPWAVGGISRVSMFDSLGLEILDLHVVVHCLIFHEVEWSYHKKNTVLN